MTCNVMNRTQLGRAGVGRAMREGCQQGRDNQQQQCTPAHPCSVFPACHAPHCEPSWAALPCCCCCQGHASPWEWHWPACCLALSSAKRSSRCLHRRADTVAAPLAACPLLLQAAFPATSLGFQRFRPSFHRLLSAAGSHHAPIMLHAAGYARIAGAKARV